jgi:hypothetical protein
VDSETKRIKELGNAESNFRAAGEEDKIRDLMGQVSGLSDQLEQPEQQPEPVQ